MLDDKDFMRLDLAFPPHSPANIAVALDYLELVSVSLVVFKVIHWLRCFWYLGKGVITTCSVKKL